MKKKLLLLSLIILSVITITGCKSKKDYGLEFKKEYEALNGTTNKGGKEHRTVAIPQDNPYIKVNPSEIVEKIDNKETFYLYVGDPLCPWCRSVIEKSIEVAKEHNIKKIYYIDIWDDDGNEILRDKYEFVDGKLTQTKKGTSEYNRLLKEFKDVLRDYELVNEEDGKTYTTGEKRIYAPNFFYIKDGKVVKLVTGKSEKQKDSREELTEEILQDEEDQFNELFKLQNECKDKSC